MLIGSFFTSTIGISNNDYVKQPIITNDNNLIDNLMKFDDYHDVGIKKITSPEVYIQPGTEDIKAIVENNGTYPEYNLSCYAEIYEYITDPINGTLVYEDEIIGIDLEEPNGGTKLLTFNSNTFPDEGLYNLIIDLPLEGDDLPENNQRELIIAVDDTDPVSDYPPIFDPPVPDGNNGWYVNDVIVNLSASDPWSDEVSSGVRELRYTINGCAEQVISGSNGSFILTEDGDDILVEYWAVDNVGNVESPKNSFTIDIDQTTPEVSITYEIVGGNRWQGWDLEFTFNAIDDMSGACILFLYLDNELIEIFQGSGPDYVWTLRYWPGQNFTIKFVICDCAGNCAITIFNLSDIDVNRHSRYNFFYEFLQNVFFKYLINKILFLEDFL